MSPDTSGTSAVPRAEPPVPVEAATLLIIGRYLRSGLFDGIVVDCPSPRATLHLLGLSESALTWSAIAAGHHTRGLDMVIRTLGLGFGQRRPVSLAVDLVGRLRQVREQIAGVSIVRVVSPPGNSGLVEARQLAASASLLGYPVDCAIVNHGGPRTNRDAANGHTSEFGPLPIRRVYRLDRDPGDTAALQELARAVFGEDDPLQPTPRSSPAVEPGAEANQIKLALPGARREEIAVEQIGSRLRVCVGDFCHILPLNGYGSKTLARAQLVDSQLIVTFE